MLSEIAHSPAKWHCILHGFHLIRNVQPQFREWIKNVEDSFARYGDNTVCTDRHGFKLKVGDRVGDYANEDLEFVITEINKDDVGSRYADGCPEGFPSFKNINYTLIGNIVKEPNEQPEDEDAQSFIGNEHWANPEICYAIEQGERASFCEVCENHFDDGFVTWDYGKRRKRDGSYVMTHSACDNCNR